VDLTPRASRILELAERRARELGHDYVGTEHLLLALCDDPDGLAARAIEATGSVDAVRRTLLEIMESEGYNTPTLLVGDADGPVGRIEIGPDGRAVVVDFEGNPRPWPHETDM
jgi:hypothetical protein